MPVVLGSRTVVSRSLAGAATTLVLALAGCGGGDNNPAGPNLPDNPPAGGAFRQSAFILDVSTSKKTVKVTGPSSPTSHSVTQLGETRRSQVSHSLLGADVVQVVVSNYNASDVGAGGAPPGKILVTFDLQIRNIRSGVQLVRPTFPIAPSTTLDRIYAFPFGNVVTTTQGSATGSGNEVIIELPNRGNVDASTDWNGDGATLPGDPFNFFNDASCGAGTNDCFRYEAYDAPLGPLSGTPPQRVGYVIDATVSNFRSRIILAADLADAGAPVSTTIHGLISSGTRGPLAGVIVSIDGSAINGPGGTLADGLYSAPVSGTGFKTVHLSNLPSGCTAPADQTVTVTSTPPAGGYTADFNVSCTGAVGTVTGTVNVTRNTGATQSLSGLGVTATPAATGTSPTSGSLTGAAGATTYNYSLANVQVGTGAGQGNGQISLATLPAGCTGTTTSSYTGLTSGGSVAAPAISVTCDAPPAFYPLVATWSNLTATTVDVTFSIDMNGRNDPTDPAPDALIALTYEFDYSASSSRVGVPAVVNTACTRLDGGNTFDVFTRNVTAAKHILMSVTATGGATGTVQLMKCTLPVTTGPSGTATGSFVAASTVATIAPTGAPISINA